MPLWDLEVTPAMTPAAQASCKSRLAVLRVKGLVMKVEAETKDEAIELAALYLGAADFSERGGGA